MSNRLSAAVTEHGPGLSTTLIVLALIVGAVCLTWIGKVNGDAFVALASAIVGGVLVRQGAASASKASDG